MKTKIIKLNNKVDTKKFERKIWIYKSIIYKRTKFISKDKREIKNIVEDVKIKEEYFDFNEITSQIKIRIKITSKMIRRIV